MIKKPFRSSLADLHQSRSSLRTLESVKSLGDRIKRTLHLIFNLEIVLTYTTRDAHWERIDRVCPYPHFTKNIVTQLYPTHSSCYSYGYYPMGNTHMGTIHMCYYLWVSTRFYIYNPILIITSKEWTIWSIES